MYHELGRWPTEKGIAVPIDELWLPPSHTIETNNHHGEFEAYRFCINALYNTLRNLKCNQRVVPIDQHDWAHYHLDSPIFPTPIQAMNKIEEQLDCGGLLKIKHKGKGYTERPLTDDDFQRCKDYYDSLKK